MLPFKLLSHPGLTVDLGPHVFRARSGVNPSLAGGFSPAERRALEVPWSLALVEGVWLAAGAAIEAGRRAPQDGCAVVLGGGFHHAFPDHGEGFCLVHDVAVATAALRATGEAARVSVVDLDVHARERDGLSVTRP